MPSALEAELTEILQTHQGKNEKRSVFLARLARKATKISDDDWERLSTTAQAWVTHGVDDCMNAGKPVPEFPDMSAHEEEDDSADAPDRTSGVNGASVEGDETDDAEAAPEGPEDGQGDGNGEPGQSSEETAEVKKKAAKKKSTKKTAARRTAPPAREAGRKPATRYVRELVIRHPTMTVEELLAKAMAQGYTSTRISVATVKSDTLATLRVLRDLGVIAAA